MAPKDIATTSVSSIRERPLQGILPPFVGFGAEIAAEGLLHGVCTESVLQCGRRLRRTLPAMPQHMLLLHKRLGATRATVTLRIGWVGFVVWRTSDLGRCHVLRVQEWRLWWEGSIVSLQRSRCGDVIWLKHHGTPVPIESRSARNIKQSWTWW